MSTIRITLLKTVDISKPNASKNYQQMVVTHQEVGKDKPDGKKIFDFTTPKEVWETLKAAPAGATFEVDRQKDAKEGKYWEWKAIRPADGIEAPVSSPTAVASSPAAATPARVGNWETPEERGKKQVYIVRQSTINAALEYHKSFGGIDTEVGIQDILTTARRFEDYVFDRGIANMENDYPE